MIASARQKLALSPRDLLIRGALSGALLGTATSFAFGGALTEIQEITGRWFAPVQGGTYASGAPHDLIALMRRLGAFGVGQSSWGPTVYGIVSGGDDAVRLATRVREWLGDRGTVYEGSFRSTGARVWREPVLRD